MVRSQRDARHARIRQTGAQRASHSRSRAGGRRGLQLSDFRRTRCPGFGLAHNDRSNNLDHQDGVRRRHRRQQRQGQRQDQRQGQRRPRRRPRRRRPSRRAAASRRLRSRVATNTPYVLDHAVTRKRQTRVGRATRDAAHGRARERSLTMRRDTERSHGARLSAGEGLADL